jgi:hypothetical protein
MMKYTSWPRQSMAVALSLLLLLFAQSSLNAQAYAALDAMQLDQLVAPIALYPDALVAQVLTASTFSDQVNDANNWMQQNGGMPPDQLAAAVNGMSWDPSVKALTEFPTVLANMARNNGWTVALGNAYYNQPGDVMNAVQAMRFQAQQAGTLRSTPQERVYINDGLVVIDPVNPALIYVPYYNPWTVWGTPIAAWGGYYWGPPAGIVFGPGIAIGFGVGIGIGLFGHFGWGYSAWSPNWHGGVVAFNHTTYISRSTTVINHGNFGGANRGVFEHAGRGVPGGYHPAVTAHSAAFHGGGGGTSRPAAAGGAHAAAGGGYHPAGNVRPGGAAHPGTTQGYHPAGGAAHAGPGQTYHTPAANHAAPAQHAAAPHAAPAQHAAAPHSAPAQHAAPHAAPAQHAAPAHNAPAAHAGGGGARPPAAHSAPAPKRK